MAEGDRKRQQRELQELVNELRVALPGVQVLFSFLLIVPFNQRWGRTTDFDHAVYLATLLLAAAASALLIAPSAQHRLLFRRGYKERMLITANRLAIAGIGCLGLAIIGAVLLVTHVLFGIMPAAATSSGAGLLIAWGWYLLPLRARDAEME